MNYWKRNSDRGKTHNVTGIMLELFSIYDFAIVDIVDIEVETAIQQSRMSSQVPPRFSAHTLRSMAK